MSAFTSFTILMALLTVLSVLVSLFSSVGLYKSKMSRKKYIKRGVTEAGTEKNIMKELMDGEIKCHLLPNSSSIFKVEKWVNGMIGFMEKPIYKEILSLEGKNIDEEY